MLGETKKKRKPFSEGRHDGGAQVYILKVMKITPKQNVTGLIISSGLAIARKYVVEGLSLWTRFLCCHCLFFLLFPLVLIFRCVTCLYIVYTYASTNPFLRSLRSCIYNCRTVYHIVNTLNCILDQFSTSSRIDLDFGRRSVTLDA